MCVCVCVCVCVCINIVIIPSLFATFSGVCGVPMMANSSMIEPSMANRESCVCVCVCVCVQDDMDHFIIRYD